MKKRRVIVFTVMVLMIGLTLDVNGQRRKSGGLSSSSSRLKHAPGIKSFGLSYGFSEGGKYYQVDGLFYIAQKTAVGVIGSFNKGMVNGIEYDRYEFSPTVLYSPFNVSGFFYLNVYGGLTARYETFDNIRELDLNNQFNIGLLVQGEGEVFFNESLSAVVFVRQDYFIFKPGKWRNVVGFGLRLNLK